MTTDPNPNPDPDVDPTPEPTGDDTPQGSRLADGGRGPEQTAPIMSTSGGNYAVYDTRYERFVGGVQAKKPTKKAAAELAGHDDVEIREV